MRSLIVFVVLGAVSLLLRGSEAVDYQVGDGTGWRSPSSTSFYSDWASGKTFALGDTLSKLAYTYKTPIFMLNCLSLILSVKSCFDL
jgi:hypothetical protein